jgi:DNA/RNA-binding domain of Phe-tRNA-synthetase-like protein
VVTLSEQAAHGRVELDGALVSTALEGVHLGLVLARGVSVAPASPSLVARLVEELVRAGAGVDGEAAQRAVRELLRHGRYKPTGRGKPASEYLLGAAREGRFPRINNLVDVINLVSLATLLPISLIDLGRAGRDAFVVRRGRAGEAYVFNAAGQSIELEDLLLVAMLPEDLPCANPVKDSMATKLDAAARDVLAVVYAPASMQDALRRATQELAVLLAEHGRAAAPARAALLSA